MEPQRSESHVVVRRADEADVPLIAGVVARAFDDDPFINFIVKQDRRRADRIASWARGAAAESVALGETYVTLAGDGAALWTPPGQPHTANAFTRLRRLAPRTGLARALSVDRALGVLGRKTPREPHFYLRIIGVEPGQQRRGIGGRLMQPVLERCDRERIAAYLFSTKQQNLALYERNGFRVVKRIDIRGGPPLWTMWRDPA
jgi:ribosomal protein S18 acetylase RimI-like enzyme